MGKQKRDMTVTGRLPEPTFNVLEEWRERALLGRKRSEVVGLLIERIVAELKARGLLDQPLEHIVRWLRVQPA